MGNFEKLSVLVIGVIIVMILVVAVYTWTGDPGDTGTPKTELVPTDGPTFESTDLASTSTRSTWDQFDPPAPGPKLTAVDTVVVEDIDSLDAKVDGKETASAKTVVEDVVEETVAVASTEETYEIQSNDTLGLISQKFYGTTKYWPKIAERNGLVPERLSVGKKIFIPVIDALKAPKSGPANAAPSSARLSGAAPGGQYTVRGGETIQEISRAAYGTIERWVDIYVTNLEVVNNPRSLATGTVLRLPE